MRDLAVYYGLRNSEWVRIRNIPIPLFLYCIPTFILGMIWEFIYFAIKHERMRLYFRAKYDALKLVPIMMEKRRTNLKRMSIDSRDLKKMMTPAFERGSLTNKLKRLICR